MCRGGEVAQEVVACQYTNSSNKQERIIVANLKERYRKELKVQQKIEGYTPETALLFMVLGQVRTQQEWGMLTMGGEHRYGKLSYECHHFHYPSALLKRPETMFTEDLHSL